MHVLILFTTLMIAVVEILFVSVPLQLSEKVVEFAQKHPNSLSSRVESSLYFDTTTLDSKLSSCMEAELDYGKLSCCGTFLHLEMQNAQNQPKNHPKKNMIELNCILVRCAVGCTIAAD